MLGLQLAFNFLPKAQNQPTTGRLRNLDWSVKMPNPQRLPFIPIPQRINFKLVVIPAIPHAHALSLSYLSMRSQRIVHTVQDIVRHARALQIESVNE